MATIVFLGNLFGCTMFMYPFRWKPELTTWRGTGDKAIIAKGNIIEGIMAKE